MSYITYDYPGYIPATLPFKVKKQKRGLSPAARFFRRASLAFAVIGILVLIFSYGPSLFYTLSAKNSNETKNMSISNVEMGTFPMKLGSSYQPPVDRQLARENKIEIPSIGVKTTINEALTSDFEIALEKGVWRDGSFGTPADRTQPLILAAHRYGYLEWDNTYRHLNSFYNLPKLQSGDTVEIVWNQRKYIYAIYGESEGESVQDHSADLILYTCNDLNSPVRVFKYGKLLEI